MQFLCRQIERDTVPLEHTVHLVATEIQGLTQLVMRDLPLPVQLNQQRLFGRTAGVGQRNAAPFQCRSVTQVRGSWSIGGKNQAGLRTLTSACGFVRTVPGAVRRTYSWQYIKSCPRASTPRGQRAGECTEAQQKGANKSANGGTSYPCTNTLAST
jgi:hypothetical protein